MKLNPFKDFQSDQIQGSSRKIFTAHYTCRNAALNLTPVTGTTNGFIFQIINSLIESWGVRLTWFDCNGEVRSKEEANQTRPETQISRGGVTRLSETVLANVLKNMDISQGFEMLN